MSHASSPETTSLPKSSVNRSRTTLRVRSGSPYSSCGRVALLDPGLDVAPPGGEPLDVAGELLLGGALRRGAHDDAGRVGDDLLEQRLEPGALGVGELAGDAAGGAVGHVDQEPAREADLAGEPGTLVADRVLGDLHQDRLAGLEHLLDLAGAVAGAQRVPVHLAGVEDRVAALADVDERRLHGGQDVLHAAEVDVADQRGLRLAGDVVLDEHLVLEDRDLGEVLVLPDHHDAVDRLAAGQELGLAHDRGAPATGLPALAATLLLRLETGGAVQAGDLVLGVARLADPGDGVLRVVRTAVALLARAATTAPTTGGAALVVAVVVAVLGAVRRRRRCCRRDLDHRRCRRRPLPPPSPLPPPLPEPLLFPEPCPSLESALLSALCVGARVVVGAVRAVVRTGVVSPAALAATSTAATATAAVAATALLVARSRRRRHRRRSGRPSGPRHRRRSRRRHRAAAGASSAACSAGARRPSSPPARGSRWARVP